MNMRWPFKSSQSEQLCRVGEFGLRGPGATSPLADGEGRLWIRNFNPILPPNDPASAFRQVSSPPGGVLVSSMVFPSDFPCRIVSLTGYNASPDLMYVMLFEQYFIFPGITPVITIPVPGNATNFSYSAPWVFSTFAVGMSSTEFTFTPAAFMSAACIVEIAAP